MQRRYGEYGCKKLFKHCPRRMHTAHNQTKYNETYSFYGREMNISKSRKL